MILIYSLLFFCGAFVLLLGEKKRMQPFYAGAGDVLMQLFPAKLRQQLLNPHRYRKIHVANEEGVTAFAKQHIMRLLGRMVLCFTLFSLLGLCYEGAALSSHNKKYITLNRDVYGGEVMHYPLLLEQSEGTTKEVTISVYPQEFETKKREQLWSEGMALAWKTFLGRNKSYEEILYSVHPVQQLEEVPLSFHWWWEEQEVLSPDGILDKDQIKKEIAVTVTLEADFDGEIRKEQKVLLLQPQILTKEEQQRQEFLSYVKQMEKKNRTKNKIRLPLAFEGLHIKEPDQQKNTSVFLFLAVGIPLLLLAKNRQEEKEKLEQKKRQFQMVYPNILQKLTLYIGAGMTVRAAFVELADSFTTEYDYVKEELCALSGQLNMGQNELVCYEAFATQTEDAAYRRLVTLLSQNLKKGSKELLVLLKQERQHTLFQQTEQIRKRGEEASTRLLFPMLLLLLVAMLFVMVPAFFQVM